MTTFRSGSTPIHLLLSAYLEQTEGITSLDAFFDLWEYGYRETKNGIEIVRPREPKLGPKLFMDMPLHRPRSIAARTTLLQRHYKNYFVKSHPLMGRPMSWLLQTHDFIFTERKDLPAQIVSYLISCAYGRWYREAGLFPKPRSLVARKEWFNELEVSLGKYFALKILLPSAPVITYEDFCNTEPKTLLARAGLKKRWRTDKIELPQRQNSADLGEKIIALRNQKAVASWYKNSFLQDRCPWPY